MESETNPKGIPPKKRPAAKTKNENEGGRARAKTAIFEGKGKQTSTETKKIVVEGIGQETFQERLSLFSKKNSEQKEEDNKPKPGALDLNRLGSFSKKQESNDDNKVGQLQSTVGMSIQERMALLQKNAEELKTKGTKSIDPVLEVDNHEDEECGNEDEELNLDEENEVKDQENLDDDLGKLDLVDDLGSNEEKNSDKKDEINEPEPNIAPDDDGLGKEN